MHVVSIEGREADLQRFLRTRVERHLTAKMLYDQFVTAMGRGQHKHHRREHAAGLLGIVMIVGEGAGIVNKKLIEVGRNRLAQAEPEGCVGDESGQGLLPMTPSDANLAGIDLPGSSDLTIECPITLIKPSTNAENRDATSPDRDSPISAPPLAEKCVFSNI